MRRGAVACLLATLLVAPAHTAAGKAPHSRVGLVLHDNTAVYAKPSAHAKVLARLVQQTQVRVERKKSGWSHVQIWASVHGWIRSKDITFRKPWATTSTYSAPRPKPQPRPYGPEAIRVRAVTTAPVELVRWSDRAPAGALPSGRQVAVTAWRQDETGRIWYRIGSSWALGNGIQFEAADPGTVRLGGHPLWARVSGKGMWLTLGNATTGASDAVVRAAQDDGISHLYVESAISPLGFHGKGAVDALLDVAHRHHLTVIAWVYPYLDDVAADVRLTRAVAHYVTPHGDRFDGIAGDIERNFTAARVRAYSQLVRASLGTRYLMVGVTYPPQSIPDFPFSEVAHSFNAIAPMDYWHQTLTSRGLNYGNMAYGYAYAYRYAVDSVRSIQRVSGHVPVAPIGQTFDDFGRLEMGPHAPSAAEVQGFLHGSKDAGAIGASFFQWMTATDGEWRAIKTFSY